MPRSVQKLVCNPVAFGYIKRFGTFVKCASQPQGAADSQTCQSPVVKGEKTGAISQVSRELVNPRDKTALNWFSSHYSGDCLSTPCRSCGPWESFPTGKKEKERMVSGAYKLQDSAVKSANTRPPAKGRLTWKGQGTHPAVWLCHRISNAMTFFLNFKHWSFFKTTHNQ